jgi:hypothetical protein
MHLNDATVYLVSCVARKRDRECLARDLYVSDWFRKALRFVESTGCQWFILSAEHGLVAPDQPIRPYERTLNKMAVADRREWAERVAKQITKNIPGLKSVMFLAGARYREFLTTKLTEQGMEVSVPMASLRIGEQLNWLSQQTPNPAE